MNEAEGNMESNTTQLITTIVIGIILIPFATAFYGAFLLGFAGLPGAMLTDIVLSKGDPKRLPLFGLAVTVFCQSFFSIAFVVIVVLSVHSVTVSIFGFGRWFIWFLTFFVAVGPAFKAARSAGQLIKEDKPENTKGSVMPCYAAMLTLPLTILSFFVYSLFPRLTEYGWNWLPHY